MKKLAWFLSFLTGFVSLSEEVLWIRIVGFAFESTPRAFSLVLTAFLGGLALGALAGKRLSEQKRATPITAAWLLILSGSILFFLPAIVAAANETPLSIIAMLFLIMIGAAIKGTLFPVVHHIGSAFDDAVGRSVSRTYFSNIIGATLGPLATGLVLLNYFSSGVSLQILGALCFIGAIAPLVVAWRSRTIRPAIAGFFWLLIFMLAFPSLLENGESLMHKLAISGDGQVKVLIENSHGVIHSVSRAGDDSDTVFGGNVYDGKTSIDLVSNSNMIDRAYLLYGLHPAPKRVLVIGLSSGAWTRIITGIPGVEQIDVVEINPGYIEMILGYSHLSPLLDDPRLFIHIDDGRRWLRRNHKKFDLIVMNTTFHWRAYVTNLLSVEMMHLLLNSLAPNGIFAFNTTGSDDAFHTAAEVFPFAFRFRNFVYAADHDFRDQVAFVEDRVRKFEIDGRLIINGTTKEIDALRSLSAAGFTDLKNVEDLSPRRLMTITDQNMITEFRFGRGSDALQE